MPISVPPMSPTRIEGDDQHETEQAKGGGRLLEVAQGHQGGRMGDHDLGLLERDDARGRARRPPRWRAQVPRDRVDDVFADAKIEMRKNNTPEQNTPHRQRLLPGIFVGQHRTVKAKKALRPMPGASAIGIVWHRAPSPGSRPRPRCRSRRTPRPCPCRHCRGSAGSRTRCRASSGMS